jgi:AcrR family transcriptional regulator
MSLDEKKPYHHGDLRGALLAAAEAALSEMPLEDVSLREIARRAGVSHAAPKHHFSSLGQLFGEVAAMGFERFHATLSEASNRSSGQSPAERLLAMGRAYVRFSKENATVYGLMFGKRDSVVETTPHLATAMYNAWELLHEHVTAVVGAQKSLNGAVTVWSTVHGIATLRNERKLPPQVDPEAAAEASVRTIVAGLLAEA